MRPDEELGSIGPAFTEGGVWDTLDPVGEDRYEEGGALGSGGMGVVSVAVDTWLDREVARKRPRVDLPAGTRDRLVREARITARLAHPGIVPVLDYGEDEEGPYYTMPVLEGVTLDAAVREGRPLVRLVRVLAEVARAVAYAHDRGIVHRDLKPANVLLGAFGEVRVLDWGVAFDPREPDAEAVGTP
ncbi:MAG: serine/threonine protein kinase, partial [Alphaproteobacteria bacterium]|nr:serine/threonine protein kinase [Alphaproteobacteria bacterium]